MPMNQGPNKLYWLEKDRYLVNKFLQLFLVSTIVSLILGVLYLIQVIIMGSWHIFNSLRLYAKIKENTDWGGSDC